MSVSLSMSSNCDAPGPTGPAGAALRELAEGAVAVVEEQRVALADLLAELPPVVAEQVVQLPVVGEVRQQPPAPDQVPAVLPEGDLFAEPPLVAVDVAGIEVRSIPSKFRSAKARPMPPLKSRTPAVFVTSVKVPSPLLR